VNFRNCSNVRSQADRSSGNRGNVRDFTKTQEVSEKILSGKIGQKLFIVSCIFASVPVFSSIQLVLA